MSKSVPAGPAMTKSVPAGSDASAGSAVPGSLLLDACLGLDRGQLRLDVALSLRAGEVVALVGPNGAGKSTVLRALAGLLPLRTGYIDLAGRRVDDPATGQFTGPERRATGLVFQDYLLFPHLSVLDNVAFGPRCAGLGRAAARAEAAGWLARLGLTGYARCRPAELSGGQAQRVALARALAVRPALLLLDEPLAALDAGTRLDVRAELAGRLADHPGATMLVTHDLMDAMVLADRLLVIEQGRIVQQGAPAAVAAAPRTDYVARLVGLNLFRGWADGRTVTLSGGARLTIADPLVGEVFVTVDPAGVTLGVTAADAEPDRAGVDLRPASWPVRVRSVERYGDRLRVRLDGAPPVSADLSPLAAAGLPLRTGQRLWATVATGAAYPVRSPSEVGAGPGQTGG